MKELNLLTAIKNIMRNICFTISAVSFFVLCVAYTPGYFIGVVIAGVIILLMTSQISSVWGLVKTNPIPLHVISLFSTIGVCLTTQNYNYEMCKYVFRIQDYMTGTWAAVDVCAYISVIGTVIGFYFVFVCISLFWKEFVRIIAETGLFKDLQRKELVLYAIMIVAALLLVTFSFSRTDAFYGTAYSYDVIYTSDSPYLVKGNVYVILAQAENDLRQPLFAVFAAPFIGVSYFVARIFSVSASVQAMLINYVQVVMLFVANYMLTKIMKLNSIKRMCFMVLCCCTYSQLLFMQMMEQYMVAYFWLVFCIYIICEEKQSNRMVLWGAGGTLLTSLILAPFMSKNCPIKDFKKWFFDMVRYAIEFVVVLLAFCRFDIIYNLMTKLSFLGEFTGRSLTITDKIYQYTEFIHNCFFAPKAGADFVTFGHVSWQLLPVTELNLLGVAMLIVAIISVIINRDKKSSLLAGIWTGFSVVLLLGLGWGMAENGLILYSLYFGWAFLVLIFQLVEKIEGKLNINWLIPVFSIGSIALMLLSNVPAMMEMLHFATVYFPV